MLAGASIVVGLVVFVAACSSNDNQSDAPPTISSSTPDRKLEVPATAYVGEMIQVSFPRGTARGLQFTFSRQTKPKTWELTYWLFSGAHGNTPSAVRPGESYASPSVAILGDEPDPLLLPTDVQPGRYQICSYDPPQYCGEITIEAK